MFAKLTLRFRLVPLSTALIVSLGIWSCSGGSSSSNVSNSSAISNSSSASSTLVQNELQTLSATLNASETYVLTDSDIQGLASSGVLQDGDSDALALLSKH